MEPKSQPTDVGTWKKASQGVPLEVPSGHTALVRPVGMQVFLERGLIPNSLRQIVIEAMRRGKPPEMGEDVTEEQISDMLALFDAVTVYCVQEPKVHAVPMRSAKGSKTPEKVPLEERDQDLLYVDEVALDDKTFIFQFVVGGTRDLERFRTELAANVAAISGRQDVERPAERVG